MEDERRKEKRKIEEVIPQELLKLPCWVGYQLRRNKDRTDKVPMNVLTGRPAKNKRSKHMDRFHDRKRSCASARVRGRRLCIPTAVCRCGY